MRKQKIIYHGGLNLLMYTPLILMILVNMNSMLLNSLVFIVIKQIKTNFTQNLNLLGDPDKALWQFELEFSGVGGKESSRDG